MKFLIIVKENEAKQIDSIEEASCIQYLNGYCKLFVLDSVLNTASEVEIPQLKLVKKEEKKQEQEI